MRSDNHHANLLIFFQGAPMPRDVFMKFIQLIQVVESASPLQALEPIEKSLLRIIALANLNKERLSVKDLMDHSGLASPATTHKHIHAMVEKDWIELAPTEDARRKQIQLTSSALKHFDNVGRAAIKATAR